HLIEKFALARALGRQIQAQIHLRHDHTSLVCAYLKRNSFGMLCNDLCRPSLVRKTAGEIHDRDMRLDPSNAPCGMSI
ncbi:hypothetical protein, partial [Caballeronia choica]|uniref:hypothetical protein n=1 Tax=Caballeronia choica TaxID=326476 RepID=UPI001F3A5186